MLRRLWRWLFPIRPFSLELSAPPSAVVEALRAGSRRTRTPTTLLRGGLIGRVDEGRVQLIYSRPFTFESTRLVFVGRVVPRSAGSCLTGEFRASRSTRASFVGWAGFIVLWWCLAVPSALLESSGTFGLGTVLIFVLAPPMMLAFGGAIVRLSARLDDARVGYFERALRLAIESRVP